MTTNLWLKPLTLLLCALAAIAPGVGWATLDARAADEPLIPPPLNAVISQIKPDMTTNEVTSVLAVAYPKVVCKHGVWSGQTGYFDYVLNDRYTLSVSSYSRYDPAAGRLPFIHLVNGNEDRLFFYVFDFQKSHRVAIEQFFWDKKGNEKPPLPDPKRKTR